MLQKPILLDKMYYLQSAEIPSWFALMDYEFIHLIFILNELGVHLWVINK